MEQQNQTRSGRSAVVARALALSLLALSVTARAAGWQWLDDSGRRVYSDRAPPPTVPERHILQRPAAATAAVELLPSAAAAAAGAPAQTPAAAGRAENASERPPTDVERQLREAAGAEAARLAAQEKRNAEIRRENCERARSALATLLSGVRLMTTDAQGEPAIMDDEVRAQQIRRMRQHEQENCRAGAVPRPAQ